MEMDKFDMRVGIFGDSYACTEAAFGKYGWPDLIGEKFTITNHSRSGTSMWWSFEKFLQYHDEYDIIVFSFTSNTRWPAVPKKIEYRAWNIGFVRENDDFLDVLNPYFFEVFPENLRRYINSSIYKDVVDICVEKGKYLVSIIPFAELNLDEADFDVSDRRFPIMVGLDKVSHLEEVMIDGAVHNTVKYLKKSKIIEHRPCHLNPSNNRIVADWVIDCIEQQKSNIVFDCGSINDWVVFDPVDSEMLELARNKK